MWEFLYSHYLNMGCVAGGTGEVLVVLVFTFNLWDCLMEAQHGNTECKALLTGHDGKGSHSRCVLQLHALREMCHSKYLAVFLQ